MNKSSSRRAEGQMAFTVVTVALNVPVFFLGISHVLIASQPYWQSPPRPGSALGSIWLLLFTLGPASYALSLFVLLTGRWSMGERFPGLSLTTKSALGVGAGILVAVFLSTR